MHGAVAVRCLLKRGVEGLIGMAMLSACVLLPVSEERLLSNETARFVLQAVQQRGANIQTLKGLFRASISASGLPISQQVNGVLYYRRPTSVRLKGFAQIGGTLFDFRREGNSYQLRVPSTGRAITGVVPGGEGEAAQLVDLALWTLDALIGKLDGLDPERMSLYEDDGGYRLDLNREGFQGSHPRRPILGRVWIDRQTFDIQKMAYVLEEEEVAVLIECSDFRELQTSSATSALPIRLPFTVRATDNRATGGSMTLVFQEMVANTALTHLLNAQGKGRSFS